MMIETEDVMMKEIEVDTMIETEVGTETEREATTPVIEAMGRGNAAMIHVTGAMIGTEIETGTEGTIPGTAPILGLQALGGMVEILPLREVSEYWHGVLMML